MARTKSSSIESKFLKAEHLRLLSSRQDPKFQVDLKRLEDAAKSLPHIPPIPVSEMHGRKHRLPTHSEKKLIDEWKKLADDFLSRWGFQPYSTKNGAVELFFHSPVTVKIGLLNRSPKWTLDGGHFSSGDLRTLQDYYLKFFKKHRRIVERRVNLDTMERRAVALELKAKGKTPKEIAKRIYSKQFKERSAKTIDVKTLPDGELRDRWRRLVIKYAEQRHPWPTAEKLAAKELGFDIAGSAQEKPVIARTRYLLKSRKK